MARDDDARVGGSDELGNEYLRRFRDALDEEVEVARHVADYLERRATEGDPRPDVPEGASDAIKRRVRELCSVADMLVAVRDVELEEVQ